VRGHSGGETGISRKVGPRQHPLCWLAQLAHWRLRVLRGEIVPILEDRFDVGVSRNNPVTNRLVVENRRFRAQLLVRREGIDEVEWIEILPTHWTTPGHRGCIRHDRRSWISFHNQEGINHAISANDPFCPYRRS